jgi:hypothetical protein
VYGLLEESKYFLEWSAGEADTESAAQSVELQVQLSRCNTIGPPSRREILAQQARLWSNRVLEASGVLNI